MDSLGVIAIQVGTFSDQTPHCVAITPIDRVSPRRPHLHVRPSSSLGAQLVIVGLMTETGKKNVVVTGANRGLGLALVRTYARAGHHVFAGCRTPEAANELHPLTNVEIIRLDASDFASIDMFAAIIGDRPVNTIINCAGVDARAFGANDTNRGALTISAEHFEAVMRVNVTGPLLLVERLTASLRETKGTVVNISSQIGSLTIAHQMSRDVSYAASKAALNMVTAKQAQAFAGSGVIAITLHPGWLRTDMGGPAADLDPNDAAAAIFATVEGLTIAQNGHFLRWDGTVHPW
jgi:NAD(P)-dependent dehydrogenase (short-subunit alcohol dehydrogenase family)